METKTAHVLKLKNAFLIQIVLLIKIRNHDKSYI